MATKKKKTNKKPDRRGKLALLGLAALTVALAVLLACGAVNASRVEVRRAEVYLKDLPEAFDGKTLMFASDIDLCGLNTAAKSADLFRRLREMRPDALILGGDYNSASLLSLLNRGGNAEPDAAALKARADFFRSLKDFDAPLGKYAVRAEEDSDPDGLGIAMEAGGVTPLFDSSAKLTAGDSAVYLAGLTGDPAAIAAAARRQQSLPGK